MTLFLFALLIIIFFIIYCVQNPSAIPVKFLGGEYNFSQPLLAVILLLAGMYLYSLWTAIWNISARRIIQEFSKKLIEMEEELRKKDEEIAELSGKTGEKKNSSLKEDKCQNSL